MKKIQSRHGIPKDHPLSNLVSVLSFHPSTTRCVTMLLPEPKKSDAVEVHCTSQVELLPPSAWIWDEEVKQNFHMTGMTGGSRVREK